MKLKVNLDADKFVGIKDRFIAGNETILVFESADYPIDELQVTVNDGTCVRRHSINGNEMDISQYCKKAAVIEIGVDLILRGAVAKTWKLEPFVVKEAVGGYVMIPELALLRKEIQTMKTAIKELNSKIDDTM